MRFARSLIDFDSMPFLIAVRARLPSSVNTPGHQALLLTSDMPTASIVL
jgi:hypothetical protein